MTAPKGATHVERGVITYYYRLSEGNWFLYDGGSWILWDRPYDPVRVSSSAYKDQFTPWETELFKRVRTIGPGADQVTACVSANAAIQKMMST